MLAAAGTLSEPYVPPGLPVLEPPPQVHSPDLNSQRSFISVYVLFANTLPPKSQKLPEASVQVAGVCRGPGMLLAAGTPMVPYTAVPLTLFGPFTQAHSLWPQLTWMFVMLAVAAPEPLITPQVCAGLDGCAEIVTL